MGEDAPADRGSALWTTCWLPIHTTAVTATNHRTASQLRCPHHPPDMQNNPAATTEWSRVTIFERRLFDVGNVSSRTDPVAHVPELEQHWMHRTGRLMHNDALEHSQEQLRDSKESAAWIEE